MLRIKGNILSKDILSQACAICFTSNGVVKSDGRLVMGAGVAKAFRDEFPGIDLTFGHLVKEFGNKCNAVEYSLNLPTIVSFPTKYHWRNKSSLFLIWQSAKELKQLADLSEWETVFLTPPGVGCGGLKWESVKDILNVILDDDRFIVISL